MTRSHLHSALFSWKYTMEMTSKSFTLRMDDELKARLQQEASRRDPAVTMAYVAYELLDKHLPPLTKENRLQLQETPTAAAPTKRLAAAPVKPLRYPPLRRRPKS